MKSDPASSDEYTTRRPAANPGGGQSPPQYIAMPPPAFGPASNSLSSPTYSMDDPFASPMYSPGLEMYHTAPSTPITSPLIEVPSHSAAVQRTNDPPTPGLHITIPVVSDQANSDLQFEDAFPTAEIPVDLFDDEGLSALEKIYLFARSESVFHRLYIVHALPSFLEQVTPQEAIGYVLPLVPGLARDDDEKVKEALVAELVPVIWWFFTHCQVIPDDLSVEESVYPSSTSTISVQAFTPILGTLLLSPNTKVGGTARYVVVELLSRMRKLDAREPGADIPSFPPRIASSSESDSEDEVGVEDIPVGLFGMEERTMFEQELLQQVVIGMGRLDVDDTDDEGELLDREPDDNHDGTLHAEDTGIHVANSQEEDNGEEVVSPREPEKSGETLRASENVNPYFPVLAAYSVPSPGSSNSSTPSSVADTSSSSSSSPPISADPATSRYSPSALASQSSPEPRRDTSDGETAPLQPQYSSGPSNVPSPTSASRNVFHGSNDDGSEVGHEGDEMDDGDGDQAAVGRLSSMRLIAAVTASGCLDEDTKHAFVKEVERVGHDPVYWVRKEASFALGALAKVVPDEVVLISLIPLFDFLRRDSEWHVRYSALFALPALLSRLSPSQRRSLALDTIIPLSTDESQPVRSGTLESLGEVLYTFHKDDDGPPHELVQLFLGRREDRRVRDGQQAAQDRVNVLNSLFGNPTQQPSPGSGIDSPLSSFYNDPARPLICAFNYPAVASTLGRNRWGELRDAYLEIADNREVSVRRSLAASLGEMAKIIGEANAERDLLGVWWDAVRSEEEDIREKAMECITAFVAALAKEPRLVVVNGLLTLWEEGIFRGWRERKVIAKALTGLTKSVGHDIPKVVRGLLRKALEDSVSAVREAAVSALPHIWCMFADQDGVLADLRDDIRALSESEIYRQRMTFVACLQALLLDSSDGNSPITADDKFWTSVSTLADDAVVGVRIGIARLVRVAYDRFQSSDGTSRFLLDLVGHLSLDSSHDVQSFIRGFPGATPDAISALAMKAPRHPKFAIFSRPPLPSSPRLQAETSLHLDPRGQPRRSGHEDPVEMAGVKSPARPSLVFTPEKSQLSSTDSTMTITVPV